MRYTLAIEQLEWRRLLAINLLPLKDINTETASFFMDQYAEAGAVTYFFGGTGNRNGLWKTNGTESGTVLVRDFSSSNYGGAQNLTVVGNTLYFTIYSGSGLELWKSNGTSAGTLLVKDIEAGANGSYPYHLVNVAGTLYFSAFRTGLGRELWKSNGTSAGTVAVRDLVSDLAHPIPNN